MKVVVNKDTCIGCGACQAICPEVFEVDEVAEALIDEIPADLEESVRDAVDGCPVSAIEEK